MHKAPPRGIIHKSIPGRIVVMILKAIDHGRIARAIQDHKRSAYPVSCFEGEADIIVAANHDDTTTCR